MVAIKIPALRELKIGEKSKKRNDSTLHVLKFIGEGAKKSTSATKSGVKNLSSKIKKLSGKERKKKAEFSDDYWEKVKNEDAD